jgi:hypothetical protein
MNLNRAFVALLVASVLPRLSSAQVVEGDVYLSMRSGDLAKVAGSRVALLVEDSVMAIRRRACRTDQPDSLTILMRENGDMKSKQRWVDIILARTDSFTAELSRHVLRSSPTGMAAHYRVDSVPAGAYVLWAETQVGSNSYAWLVPAKLAPNQTTKIDLDNSNVSERSAYCLGGRP